MNPFTPGTPEHDAWERQEAATLDDVHAVFVRWLGDEYDLDALDLTLATAAAEQLDGDPLWAMIVSGSGNAKTETVQALAGIGAHVTSTITSEGALLSGSAGRDKAHDATGGLLRKIGDRGLLVVKDFTSVLSMNTDTRAGVLAALREVYDGKWERNVGSDGGRTLTWTGRIGFLGAVTTAWDRAHGVIAAMGDRFVILRMDSTNGRQAAGRKAIGNTGQEVKMRAELAEAISTALAHLKRDEEVILDEEEGERILACADLVTLARTAVDYDYRGDVIDAHAPEMPTRFAKQLAQVMRGGMALGMGRDRALQLAIRCARDSMPALRLALLLDLDANPNSSTRDLRRRLNKPRATVDRQLQSLHMLGLLECDEEEESWRGQPATIWRYRITKSYEPVTLDPKISARKTTTYAKAQEERETPRLHGGISGTDFVGETPMNDTICLNCKASVDSIWHGQICLGDTA